MAEMLATMVVTSREVHHSKGKDVKCNTGEREKAQNDKEQLPIPLLESHASSVQ